MHGYKSWEETKWKETIEAWCKEVESANKSIS